MYQSLDMISTQIHRRINAALYRHQIIFQQPAFDRRLTSRSGEDANAISSAGMGENGTIRRVSVKEGMKELWQKSIMISTQIHGPINTALCRR